MGYAILCVLNTSCSTPEIPALPTVTPPVLAAGVQQRVCTEAPTAAPTNAPTNAPTLQVLRYGNVIYLQNQYSGHRWLETYGGASAGGLNVEANQRRDRDRNSAQWTVTGGPHGQVVPSGAWVHLRNGYNNQCMDSYGDNVQTNSNCNRGNRNGGSTGMWQFRYAPGGP